MANKPLLLLLMFFALLAAAFFLTNRAAYRGFLSDDDFSNIGWPTFVGNDVFIHGLWTPVYSGSHFRPVGFAYFRYAGRAFDLNFPPYVLIIQLIHLLNAALLYFVLRRLALSPVAGAVGTLIYTLSAVTMETYWQPMYAFDLLCGTFCLATLLLYLSGQWLLGLVTFWLAYKSKEVAIMLPLALAAYELWLGQRRWRRLIPYLAITLSFTVQAWWFNNHLDPTHGYALHFTPGALWQTMWFYSSALLFPGSGLVLALLLLLMHDRRVNLGLVLTAAAFVPLLGFTGKLSAAYWYVPMIGLAIALAAVAERMSRRALVWVLILWLPINYLILRAKGRDILTGDDERRAYIAALQTYAQHVPKLKAVVYQEVPEHMYSWGVEGGITKVFGWSVTVVKADDPKAKAAMLQVPMAVISYDQTQHRIRGTLRTSN